MTTRAGLRALARAELNDTGGTPLWADSLLNEWLAEAIRDYSRNLPKEATETLTSVADQESYTLAAACLRVLRVEHPTGSFRVYDPLSAGDVLDEASASGGKAEAVSASGGWDVWGPQGARVLTLRPAPTAAGEPIVVREHQLYAEPAADGDTLATPSADDDLLIFFVCNRALQWIGTDESKRQRWERERGVSAQRAGGQYERDYRSEMRRRGRSASGGRRLVVRQ